MSNQGWVKLHRTVTDSFVFQNPDRLKFWIWCLCKATHTPRKQNVGLQEVELKKGQFVFGRKKASIELNMTESKIYRLIKTFEKREKIEVESNNKYSVITIANWSFYQDIEQQAEQQSNNKLTTNEQQSNTNKNVKNVKNKKKKEIPPKWSEESIEYRLSLYLLNYMKKNNPSVKEPNLQKWSDDMDKIIRIDGRSTEEIKAVIKFAQTDPFWMSNILSTSKLRKQYDQLKLKLKPTTQKNNQQHLPGATCADTLGKRRPNALGGN